MQDEKTEKLIFLRSRLLAELSGLCGLVHGSWVERYATCSRPQCACHAHKDKRHGPRAYVVVNEQGRQRPKYVANSQKQAVRDGIGQYKRMLAIAERISQINLQLMRARALQGGEGGPATPRSNANVCRIATQR